MRDYIVVSGRANDNFLILLVTLSDVDNYVAIRDNGIQLRERDKMETQSLSTCTIQVNT